MVSLGRGFSNDWDMSTSKRNFKFSQEVKGSRKKTVFFLPGIPEILFFAKVLLIGQRTGDGGKTNPAMVSQ